MRLAESKLSVHCDKLRAQKRSPAHAVFHSAWQVTNIDYLGFSASKGHVSSSVSPMRAVSSQRSRATRLSNGG